MRTPCFRLLPLDLDDLRRARATAPDGRSVSLNDIALNSLHMQDQRQIMATASHVSLHSPPPFAEENVASMKHSRSSISPSSRSVFANSVRISRSTSRSHHC